jgi:hypothetical protein
VAQGAAPDFAPDASIGWYAYNRIFIAPASGAGPVQQDRAHPYVSNDEFRVTGRQPTAQLADLDNPILQPWARDVVRKRNELILAGKSVAAPHASCWPVGVPGFLLRPMTQAMYFVQTPKVVVMILSSKQEVRHVYLTDRHSPHVKPSWYGESIGHYEGDTLVVDTIGQNDKTVVDNYRTPHSTKIHVVERWKMIEDGQKLQVTYTVDDSDAFNAPWSAIRTYRRAQQPMAEEVCAENNQHLFNYHMPVADKPDF